MECPKILKTINETTFVFSIETRVSHMLSNFLANVYMDNYRTILEIRKCITVFTSSRHLSFFWARWIHSTHLNPIYRISTLILSFHLRLGRLSGLFYSGFSSKLLHAFLTPPTRAMCHAHLIFLDMIIVIIFSEEYRLWSSSLTSVV
jgi:hypothetical protein